MDGIGTGVALKADVDAASVARRTALIMVSSKVCSLPARCLQHRGAKIGVMYRYNNNEINPNSMMRNNNGLKLEILCNDPTIPLYILSLKILQ